MAPTKKLTIPAVPRTVISVDPSSGPDTAVEYEVTVHPNGQLELDLGPTKGERGELLPATYKTKSGSLRSDL